MILKKKFARLRSSSFAQYRLHHW